MSVGIFFVAKTDGSGKLRLILDTRKVNQEFREPEVTNLPSAGVWSTLRSSAQQPLLLAQADIEAAFYRIACPPGLDAHFVLPRIRTSLLQAAIPEVALPDGVGAYTSPTLVVLPMGWNWSLYFCQCLVEAEIRRAGVAADRVVHDRHVIPDCQDQPVVAAYVDGVAAIGNNAAAVDRTIRAVHRQLETDGLKCKGVEPAGGEQRFTGLVFDPGTGRVPLSPSRLWRLRLGLQGLASRGYCSGDTMLRAGPLQLGGAPATRPAQRVLLVLPVRAVRQGPGHAALG